MAISLSISGAGAASAVCVMALSASLIAATATREAGAQSAASPPNFSSDQYGWVRVGRSQDYEPVPGTIPPIADDPAHHFVGNGAGQQTTYRIADLSNPNLMPWVKERMKKDNEEVLAGKIPFTARQSCLPAGVPAFMAYGGDNPVFFIQTPRQVWIVYSGDQQVRRVYLNVPHSEHPQPSWYGESVGHYEGDTLVIDTIAQKTASMLDPYRTPHSDKLHLIERWRTTDEGRILEVIFIVDDPEAFYQPWSGKRRYRRVQEQLAEEVCAENNEHFNFKIPMAKTVEF
jgi:hypothetical protein